MKCSVEGCDRDVRGKGFCQKHYIRFRLYGSPDPKAFDHEPIEIRFWLEVNKAGENECWLWKRPPSSNGYGRIRVKETGKEESAHRVSWWLANGKQEIPKGMVVMHSCDNKLCVNPAHLSLGTPKQNTQDMMQKGRAKSVKFVGSTNGNAVLDEEKVRFIKTSDLSHAAIARLLKVSPGCIADVRKGRRWTHVTVGTNDQKTV